MTDSGARRRRKPSPMVVFLASAALFASALGFLSYQLAQGRDPSLGAGALTAGKTQRPEVKVRKIIKRHVITTVVPAETGTAVSSAGSPSTGSAPVPATSAPAPAPAPSPAPAPAPAPVVTASS